MTMNGIGQIDRWVPEIWNSRLVSLAKKQSFFLNMIGSGNMITDYGDVEGRPGDTIHLPTTNFFTGQPITTDTATVEGNGQALTPDELQITLEMLRFAAEWTDIAEGYGMVNLPNEALDKLSYQLADAMDERLVFTAVTSHTYNLYGGGVSANSDLASSDTFNVAAIRKHYAKMMFNRALPLGIGSSGAMFGIAAHPYALADLQGDSNYTTAIEYAEVRGMDNPFFTGRIPMINGCMLFNRHNMPYGATNTTVATTYDEDGVGSGTANVTLTFGFGAEALAVAYKQRPAMKYGDYDLGTKKGLVMTSIWGRRRLVEKSSMVGHYYANSY